MTTKSQTGMKLTKTRRSDLSHPKGRDIKDPRPDRRVFGTENLAIKSESLKPKNKISLARFSIIMIAIMVVIVVVIFIYGYKYTVGLKDKLKGEGYIGGELVSENWADFEMPSDMAEKVDCYVGKKEGKEVVKKYPVKMCPVDLDDIEENRIVYEGFLIANRRYGEGFKVKDVYLRGCHQCYTINLSNGTKNVVVELEGLIEERVVED